MCAHPASTRVKPCLKSSKAALPFQLASNGTFVQLLLYPRMVNDWLRHLKARLQRSECLAALLGVLFGLSIVTGANAWRNNWGMVFVLLVPQVPVVGLIFLSCDLILGWVPMTPGQRCIDLLWGGTMIAIAWNHVPFFENLPDWTRTPYLLSMTVAVLVASNSDVRLRTTTVLSS